MSDERVGFIGLGAMGSRMAKNIINSGYPLGVYNRTSSKSASFKEIGATVYDSPKALTGNSDVVIIMITGPEALHEIMEAENGVAAGVREGVRIVNMSTVSYEATMRASAEVACKKGVFMDAPVSGTIKPAEEGALVILASGEQREVELMAPLFGVIGKETIYCGPVGKGTSMKLATNMLLANMAQAFAESIVLGRKLGLRLADMLKVLGSGAMSAPIFQVKGQAILNDNYTKTFPISLAYKDINLALATAGKGGVPLPVTASSRECFNSAMAHGLGENDICAIIKVVESLAGK